MLSLQPVRADVPVYLASLGPRNLRLTGEIADGWLAIFFDPESARESIGTIHTAASDVGRDASLIDISAQVPVAVAADPQQAAAKVRAHAALYIGGMGSKKTNFYHRIASGMGYEQEADEVQQRFLSRDYAGAAAAVPFAFLDRTCLLGDVDRIADRLVRLAESGVTSVNISCFDATLDDRVGTLRTVVEAAEKSGVTA